MPKKGDENIKGQIFLGVDNKYTPNHPNSVGYVMLCPSCNFEYGANSCDWKYRKCPECQDGVAGLKKN